MVEYHVNNYGILHDVAEEIDFGALGGNFCVQKPEM
jgi:hypothetical protein